MSRKRPTYKNTPSAGEAGVWLSSMGLSIGLLLVLGLLGLIAVNGLSVFWPKPLLRVTLQSDSASVVEGQTIVAGLLTGARDRMLPAPRTAAPQREWRLQIGNKDVYGQGFRYIVTDDALRTDYPANALVLERMEYGPAIGIPLTLNLPNGERVGADSADFEDALRSAIARTHKLRRELRRVEKHSIGKINHNLSRLHANTEKLESERGQELQTKLLSQYASLTDEAQQIRSSLGEGTLSIQLFTGEQRNIPLGQLVQAHFPNQMNLANKAVFFLRGIASFVSQVPREANTEGGIFPAIFGTFILTLLMSVAVMPFGVLAAIYLREYARQNWFTQTVRISINNLAGVPSIVFGVFGLGFLVYFTGSTIDKLFFSNSLPAPTFGTGGILWAALTLALMTVPVVIVATEEALAAVPRGAREGSLALGGSKWQTIYRVVIPAAAPGIMTGLVLAMARGAGEVAPLMLVGVVKLAPALPVDGLFPFLHLDRKFMHLGFHIYDLGFQSPDSDAAQPMVFATTLFLIALVVLLNLGAIAIRERLRRKYAVGAF